MGPYLCIFIIYFQTIVKLAHDASDYNLTSSHTKMDIVCVIDTVQKSNLLQRKKALEEVEQACMTPNINLTIISVNTIIIYFLIIAH